MNIGKIDLKTVFVGFLHFLVAFTSITVVTRIVGFNLPNAFLFAGISTIIFHLLTKNKLPITMGVSGLYIGGILYVAQNMGVEYAFGGIIVAGLIYILFGLAMFLWQDKVLKLFPDWFLSIVVLLIALTLLPIGVSLVKSSMLVGLSALLVTAIADIFLNKKYSIFAMPLGIFVGTIVAYFTIGLDFTLLTQTMALSFVIPKFSISAILSISIIAIAVIFEMLGDSKNVGDIIGINIFKEVGLGRISIGNGLGTILGGLGSSNAYTTYSENTAFVLLSRYYNPTAQLFTALFFIGIAFLTPVSQFIMILPLEAFGGVVTYLFSMIAVNSIKQIVNSGINLNEDKAVFGIMSLMISISFLSFIISGVSISSVAVATLVGLILNIILTKVKKIN